MHNGVAQGEFEPVPPALDARDLVFVGELRLLKGVDVLLDAIALLAGQGRAVTATIVGDGPDKSDFTDRAERLGLSGTVHFAGAMPARTAFARGRVLVVPSRAESLPYIVLEAGAAGLPMIVSRVGGVGEIFGDEAGLVAPGDPIALARSIAVALDDPEGEKAAAAQLRERIRSGFSADVMTDAVLTAYGEALDARQS